MKTLIILLPALLGFTFASALGANTIATFTPLTTFDLTGYYHHYAETDSTLNLYYFRQDGGMMRLSRLRCFPESGQQEMTELFSSPVVAGAGSLHRVAVERIYGKLWFYLCYSNWLGVLSLDANDDVTYYNVLQALPGYDHFPESVAQFTQDQIFFAANQTLWRWNLQSGQANSLLALAGSISTVSRCGEDKMLVTQFGLDSPDSQYPCYLMDSGFALHQLSISNANFFLSYSFDQNLHFADWYRSFNPTLSGCGLVAVNGFDLALIPWFEMDDMYPGATTWKFKTRLPGNLYASIYTSQFMDTSFSQFRMLIHNGGTDFDYYNGFPNVSELAGLPLYVSLFQDAYLLLATTEYGIVDFHLADLNSLAWTSIVNPQPPTLGGDIYHDNCHVYVVSSFTAQVYRIEISVPADDPVAPPLTGLCVYPNPARSSHALSIKNGFPVSELKIFNLRGQLVYEHEADKQIELQCDLPHLAPGVYLLRVTDGAKRSATQKLLISLRR